MDIYIGNLPVETTRDELTEMFEKFGQVTEVRLINDKYSTKSKRYAFVEMPSEDEARKAIEEINETEFKERTLVVSEAKPRKARRRRARGGKRKNRGKKRRGIYGGEDRNNSPNLRRHPRPGAR